MEKEEDEDEDEDEDEVGHDQPHEDEHGEKSTRIGEDGR